MKKLKKYKYNIFSKTIFYLSYAFYKFLVLFEVKKPKIRIFFIDFYYSLINLLSFVYKKHDLMTRFYKFCNLDYIETIFGKFLIRKNTIDAIISSPSFERRDVNFLFKIIRNKLSNKEKILFLDIGADFGYYSILVSNMFQNSALIEIYSFEPVENNRILLEKNIKLNNAKNIKIFPFAVYKEDNFDIFINTKKDATGSNAILLNINNNLSKEITKTITIDKILENKINDFDVIILKIDIEGFETEALIGARKILESNKKIYLMVEDFVNRRVVDYLQELNFNFIGKFNNYNSWWEINE